MESLKRWNFEIPAALKYAIPPLLDNYRQVKTEFITVDPIPKTNALSEAFRIHVEPSPNAVSDPVTFVLEPISDRVLWISNIRRLLTTTVHKICRLCWSVAEPYGSEEWPLTDNPVLRLNYYSPEKYDFGGGWDNKGSEIIMPISPRHLMYAQVGINRPNRFPFSQQKTQIIQQLLAEHAFRWIFMRQPTDWVAKYRPRMVDQKDFYAERQAWGQWHRQQLALEARPPLP